jgi:15-cis-phytoene synthase
MSGVAVAAPYEHCEAVTRANARNFYYGIRLLPTPRRSAMCAIYSFARRVDDIADGPGTAQEKLAGLRAASDDLHRLGQPTEDWVMLALADAAERFPIPLDAFDDLIEGARMDVVGARYERYGELITYCRRVAGSIGRLSLGVFGPADDTDADRRADDLGVAMQLTNILRDVGEDLAAGRVYLPDEDLAAFGCDFTRQPAPDALAGLIRFEASRAHGWFAHGHKLLPLLDRPSAACVATIAGTYEQLLRRIERRPEAVVRERVRVPMWSKAWVVTRALVGSRT